MSDVSHGMQPAFSTASVGETTRTTEVTARLQALRGCVSAVPSIVSAEPDSARTGAESNSIDAERGVLKAPSSSLRAGASCRPTPTKRLLCAHDSSNSAAARPPGCASASENAFRARSCSSHAKRVAMRSNTSCQGAPFRGLGCASE